MAGIRSTKVTSASWAAKSYCSAPSPRGSRSMTAWPRSSPILSPEATAPMWPPTLVTWRCRSVTSGSCFIWTMSCSFRARRPQLVGDGAGRVWSDAPPGEPALQGDQAVVHGQPEERRGEDGGVHLGDQEVHLGVVDEEAETFCGADELGRDQHEDGGGAGDPDAGEDGRDGGREDHLSERGHGAQAEHFRRSQQLRVDRRDAADRAEQDREEAGVG